jgi:hypothetical protein
MGQLLHDSATVDFPAAPKGQVFWLSRAKARRNMMNLGFSII